MPRLIDAHDLWSDIMMLPHNGDIISSKEVEQAIKDAPTVDAVEVVHGRWVSDEGDVLFHCSECETQISTSWDYDDLHWNYCPNCGAEMDGDMDSYGHNADKCSTVTYKGVKLPMPPKMDGERKDND